ncbi:dTDP-4-amino-4,6-dideoxygalactose transaminase [Paenibacillus eucommiae]|uniref:dTDP-4-amino-4,6-dideoxygalactose transaminase n=1 Tax=Paenibacillus eucommiae TaxID=1355755 RepID=A0ABS4J3L1_9BACL|nr:dTDP-4-amino-4,6-dideoxygalactose transaminase [Paenibacillus eucommiae]MBP1994430.1 dTDP-4-amino-4,6-dideoxygalactose transaminase [Paenibacillus eucommiae]
MIIPFNYPQPIGKENDYLLMAANSGKLCGDGPFTEKCKSFIENNFDANHVLLTTSCTHALEMAVLLLRITLGDEIIVPSYTFSSTVNAFILQGGKPIFIDIREDTLNIDESKIEEKITSKTKAIFVMHYAGVPCEMDTIMEIAHRYDLYVIEDAAQALTAKYKDKYLGTIGDLGTFSFHETKNYICGEGGALVINNDKFINRAEIIREKGTNRASFLKKKVDKYSWVDIGSSYLLSEMLAAFLFGQLEMWKEINEKRKKIFEIYYSGLEHLQNKGMLRLPIIPEHCTPNYHLFYILLNSEEERNEMINHLRENGVTATSHYTPLHLSQMGQQWSSERLPITEQASHTLLRLPMYYSLSASEQAYIIQLIQETYMKVLATPINKL